MHSRRLFSFQGKKCSDGHGTATNDNGGGHQVGAASRFRKYIRPLLELSIYSAGWEKVTMTSYDSAWKVEVRGLCNIRCKKFRLEMMNELH